MAWWGCKVDGTRFSSSRLIGSLRWHSSMSKVATKSLLASFASRHDDVILPSPMSTGLMTGILRSCTGPLADFSC